MPTTTNFGWTTPADTDLVKDGALAIRTLGNGIDTSMVDLKGGTTGQVLSKASNTDMDFTWVAQDDSNAIQNAIVDAKGDLISATAADTPARLAVGTDGQVLTADSTTATGLKWATPATSSNDLVRITTNNFSAATGVVLSSVFSSTYDNYLIVGRAIQTASNAINLRLRSGSSDYSTSDQKYAVIYNSWDNTATGNGNSTGSALFSFSPGTTQLSWQCWVFSPNLTFKTQAAGYRIDENVWANFAYSANNTTSYDSLNLTVSGGTFTGEISVYGLKRS